MDRISSYRASSRDACRRKSNLSRAWDAAALDIDDLTLTLVAGRALTWTGANTTTLTNSSLSWTGAPNTGDETTATVAVEA